MATHIGVANFVGEQRIEVGTEGHVITDRDAVAVAVNQVGARPSIDLIALDVDDVNIGRVVVVVVVELIDARSVAPPRGHHVHTRVADVHHAGACVAPLGLRQRSAVLGEDAVHVHESIRGGGGRAVEQSFRDCARHIGRHAGGGGVPEPDRVDLHARVEPLIQESGLATRRVLPPVVPVLQSEVAFAGKRPLSSRDPGSRVAGTGRTDRRVTHFGVVGVG